jgi:Mor family transcriptional regulator
MTAEHPLAKECADLRIDPSEDIYAILRRLGAQEETIQALAAITGGKLIYHPEIVRKSQREARRAAVLADRSGDVKEIARRHHVSLSTVYFWRSRG